MRLHRGQSVTFTKALKDSTGNQLNPATQVTTRILSPLGVEVATGPASYNLDNQWWEVRWVVPLDAEFSNLDKSWSIDWAFMLDSGQILDVVVEFDVVAVNDKLPENSIILACKSLETVEFFLPQKAENMLLEMIDMGDKVVFTAQEPSDFVVTPVEDGYIYGIRIDTGLFPVDDYLFRMTAKLPDKRTPYVEIVQGRIVPNVFWHLYPSMDSFLNKIRKRQDSVMAYTKSDIYEYLRRGVSMLNLTPPQTTTWTLENFPLGGRYYAGHDLSHYLISAAALWGLQAQNLMYSELNFGFNGQTVTLDYDPTSAIGAELDFLLGQINNEFPKAKELMLRQTQRTAVVAVRRQFHDQGLSRLDTLRRALDVRMNYLNMPLTMRYPV